MPALWIRRLINPETGEVGAVAGFVRLVCNSFGKGGVRARRYQVEIFTEAARLIEREYGCVPRRLHYLFAAAGLYCYPTPLTPHMQTLSVLSYRERKFGKDWVRYRINVPCRIVEFWAQLGGGPPPFVELIVVSARLLALAHVRSASPLPEGFMLALRPQRLLVFHPPPWKKRP